MQQIVWKCFIWKLLPEFSPKALTSTFLSSLQTVKWPPQTERGDKKSIFFSLSKFSPAREIFLTPAKCHTILSGGKSPSLLSILVHGVSINRLECPCSATGWWRKTQLLDVDGEHGELRCCQASWNNNSCGQIHYSCNHVLISLWRQHTFPFGKETQWSCRVRSSWSVKLWGNYQRAALVNKLTRLIRNYLEINLLLVIQ